LDRSAARARPPYEKFCTNATSAIFLVVLVLYPQVSSAILSAFHCRQLGEGFAVLEVGYKVMCADPAGNTRYDSYRLAAWVLLAVVPIGIPLGLLMYCG
jgi:hypothetical protein